MTTIEILNQAKLDYENRVESSKEGLCFYLGDADNEELEAKINSLIPFGIWYKGVSPYSRLECFGTVTSEGIEAHYETRLELIDILIAHFKD